MPRAPATRAPEVDLEIEPAGEPAQLLAVRLSDQLLEAGPERLLLGPKAPTPTRLFEQILRKIDLDSHAFDAWCR